MSSKETFVYRRHQSIDMEGIPRTGMKNVDVTEKKYFVKSILSNNVDFTKYFFGRCLLYQYSAYSTNVRLHRVDL